MPNDFCCNPSPNHVYDCRISNHLSETAAKTILPIVTKKTMAPFMFKYKISWWAFAPAVNWKSRPLSIKLLSSYHVLCKTISATHLNVSLNFAKIGKMQTENETKGNLPHLKGCFVPARRPLKL